MALRHLISRPPRLSLGLSHSSSSSSTSVYVRALSTQTQTPSNKIDNGARWLSSTKLRIGRLFFHGALSEEVDEAGDILRGLTENWRGFVAGSEGFLTGKTWRGLYRHHVVWGDMDSMVTHVNNVAHVRWAESARMLWARNFAKYRVDPRSNEQHLWSQLGTSKGIGLILRSIKVDYKFPMEWPDKVTVYHKIDTVREDSFTLRVIILSEKHQRPAARCLEDIVVYNYRPTPPQRPGKSPIPEFMKPHLEETLRLQREAEEDAVEAMRDVERRVGDLERRVLGRKEVK